MAVASRILVPRTRLRAILNEEGQHRLYAERDLDALERQPG
jgi:hypothetical protein